MFWWRRRNMGNTVSQDFQSRSTHCGIHSIGYEDQSGRSHKKFPSNCPLALSVIGRCFKQNWFPRLKYGFVEPKVLFVKMDHNHPKSRASPASRASFCYHANGTDSECFTHCTEPCLQSVLANSNCQSLWTSNQDNSQPTSSNKEFDQGIMPVPQNICHVFCEKQNGDCNPDQTNKRSGGRF